MKNKHKNPVLIKDLAGNLPPLYSRPSQIKYIRPPTTIPCLRQKTYHRSQSHEIK